MISSSLLVCDRSTLSHPKAVIDHIRLVLNAQNQITFISICGYNNKVDKAVESDQGFAQNFISILSSLTLFWKCSVFQATNLFYESQLSAIFIHKVAYSCRFLTEVDLRGNNLGEHGALALSKAQFKFIRNLNLEATKLTTKSITTITAINWPFLRRLNLNYNRISNKALRYILRSSTLKGNIEVLEMQGNRITCDGVSFLMKVVWGVNMKVLNLGRISLNSKVIGMLGVDSMKIMKNKAYKMMLKEVVDEVKIQKFLIIISSEWSGNTQGRDECMLKSVFLRLVMESNRNFICVV